MSDSDSQGIMSSDDGCHNSGGVFYSGSDSMAGVTLTVGVRHWGSVSGSGNSTMVVLRVK